MSAGRGRSGARRDPRAVGVALALWLAVGAGGAAGQEPADPAAEPPDGIRFRLEEPRPNPFEDHVELAFVLGEGPRPRTQSAATGRGTAESADGTGTSPARASVSIRIYNLLHERVAWAVVPSDDPRSGRRVRNLPYDVPGRYVAVWDGRAEDGYRVMSGPYFVELVVDGWTAVRKVLLTR